MAFVLGSSYSKLVDLNDTSKVFNVDLSGAASGMTVNLQCNQSTNRTIILPDADTTFVGTDTTQTLSNKTISGSSNTITNIPNSSLTLSSITITAGTGLSGGGSVSLGGSVSISLSTPVTVGNGGTGLSTYTIGDLLYASGAAALSKLADVATGSALISGGIGVAPAWGKIGLTTHISGILGVANGGTGLDSSAAANGTLLIGNGTGFTLATITAGTGVSIGNASGAITVTNTGVTSWAGGTTGLTPAGSTTGAVTLGGTLVAANGGTGLSTYTIGDLLYASGATALSKLADVATGSALISGGVGAAPSWGKIGLTTHVSGTLGVGNGGTGATTFSVGSVLLGNGSSAVNELVDVALGSVLTSGGVGVSPSWTQFTSSASASTITSRDANANSSFSNVIEGYTTTTTSAGTTTLTVSSSYLQFFTGSTTQTVVLPVVSTLVLGQQYCIVNNSTGAVTVQSSGANLIVSLGSGQSTVVTCILTSGTTASSWFASTSTSSLGVISWAGGTTGLTPAGSTTGAVTLGGTLVAANGGTGLSTYTIGDLLYASGATALSSLADVATGSALISGGVGVAPSWGKIGLTTHVSGTLGVGNGGTGFATYTTGDLLYASGAAALSKLADVATGSALISGGVGSAPAWGKIGLTTHISGILGVANGGTGLDSSTAANGTLLIGNGTGFTLATITAGTGISVGNASGAITVTNTGVTSWAGGTTGLTPAGSTTGAVTLAGVLVAANGGTGLNTYTIGDLLYASGAAALSKLADVATGSALISGGVGVAPSWGKIGLTTHISGILGVVNGGTGLDTSAAANGTLLIGNGTGFTLATITAGTGVSIGNASGAITVTNTGVTSWAGGTTGLTPAGSTTGAVTLAGVLVAANGGTGRNTLTAGAILLGNGTSSVGMLADIATGSVLTSGGVGSNPTWTAFTDVATASTIVSRDTNANTSINNVLRGYTTTVTAAGTTTLTVASTYLQYFTGATTQTVVLPVVSTLVLGQQYYIANNSSGIVTVQSSGGNTVVTLSSGQYAVPTCILTTGTTETSWSVPPNSSVAGVSSWSAGTTGFTPSTGTTGDITLAGTLVVSNGGTGQTTFGVGSILLGNGTSGFGSLADVATGSVLTSGGVGVSPGWTAFTNAATASTIVSRDANANTSINNLLNGYTTTVTAASTTTLTVASTYQQYFTGSTTQTVALPVTSTLILGQSYQIVNNSTGVVTVQSSGGNTVTTLLATQTAVVTCILTSGTGAGSWSVSIVATTIVSTTSTNATYYPTFVATQSGSGIPLFDSTSGFTINPSTNAVTLGSLDTFDPIRIGTGTTGKGVAGSVVIGVSASGGSNCVAIGSSALTAVTTGARHVAIGFETLTSMVGNNDSVAIGYRALKLGTETGNVAIGSSAMVATTLGTRMVAIGYNALKTETTGDLNVAIGYEAALSQIGNVECTAVGAQALRANIADGNTAIGNQCMVANTTGSNNVGVGDQCMGLNNLGDHNTAVGYFALSKNTGNSGSTCTGYRALVNATGGQNTTFGWQAGSAVTSGTNNVFVGYNSGSGVTLGSSNTIIGGYTGTGNPISVFGNNYTVLSDGDGNINVHFDSSQNMIRYGNGLTSTPSVAPTIASATTIAPTKYITLISGTTNIQTITPPTPISSTGGQLVLIPTGRWSLITGGNIAIAATVAVSKALTMTYDATTTQWYPSFNDPNLTNGQVLIGSTGGNPIPGTIVAGPGISVGNGSGSITISQAHSVARTSSVAVSNTDTYISASFPIAASGITAGMAFKIYAMGTYSATSAVTPTFNVRFGTAGTTADTSIIASTTSSASGTNIPFTYKAYITFRTTTTAIGFAQITNQGTTGISTTTNAMTSGALVSSLTTSAAFLGLSFNSNSGNNTATFQEVIVSYM